VTTGPTTNTANSSFVGVQAGEIHDSTIYQVLPDSPPQRKYEVGLHYLDNGVPSQARALIGEAIAEGHDNAEVRFHWVLALLSKRSLHALTTEERESLHRSPIEATAFPDDEWTRALGVVFDLLHCMEEGGNDADVALKNLRTLPDRQRERLLRHLDTVLTGGVKESLWSESCRTAEEERTRHGRTDRVWAYFEPDPIGPRARLVTPADSSGRLPAVLWSAVFLAAGTGWLLLTATGPLSVLFLLLLLVCAPAAAVTGFRWYHRRKRLREKDRAYAAPPRDTAPPKHGFAHQVDRLFEHYFTKYSPARTGREVWLEETRGVRRMLRDEIVEIYREQRVPADRVAWLIRYLVRDVRRRWLSGTLWEYRERYRTALATKVWCTVSLAASAASVAALTVTAFPERPFTTVLTTLLITVSAWFAVPLWLETTAEEQRYAEEDAERKRVLAERKAEYHRWTKKLEETRPSEKQMEAWLHADRTVILDAALRHYRLRWHDVIAHFFLLSPNRPCKQKREKHGQWRYSKYEVRVFLITHKGVREAVFDLDFTRAEHSFTERNHFRFDAIASVSVEEHEEDGITLKVTLLDGASQEIRSPREELSSLFPEENPEDLFRGNLDASGFGHSMRLLEGIGAEGEKWIDRLSTPGKAEEDWPSP